MKSVIAFGLWVFSTLGYADLNILTGERFMNERWNRVVYQTESLNANAAQMLPLLPVTDQDQRIDSRAVTRAIRYTDLVVNRQEYGKLSYCVGIDNGGVTCETAVGKFTWSPEPKGREKAFSEWREQSYASEGCFIQEKSKACQQFF